MRKSKTLKNISQNIVLNLIRFFVPPSYSVKVHVVMAYLLRSPCFKQFYLSLNFNFSIVWFLETWANDININKISSFQLPNCNTEHQIRKSGKGEEVCIFIHESLDYSVRKDLSINCNAIESLSVEICYRNSRTTIFNVVYRPPNGDKKISEQFCNDLFSKNSKNLKNMILACDFNINNFVYKQNKISLT